MFLICHSRGHWKSLAWSHSMIIISSFLISKAKPGQNVSINSENEFMDKLEKKQKEWMKNALTSTMYWNGNFGLVFGRGEVLLTYMIFVYHWTS